VPDMEKCIEKCSTVIERHSMDNGKGESNTWIDDAYFVIGKSHFYKRAYFDAERTFDYAGRRFKGQDKQLESKLWYARTAIQNEQYAKAQSMLDEVKNQKEMPKKFPHDQLSAVQADVNLKRGKVDDAIVDLEHAVDIAKNRTQRVRWMFILAQLYMAKGMEEKAIAEFNKVARSHPPYELGFHAEIFQALSFDRGNSAQLRKKLKRMRKDEKNKDHYDMIEYALADLDLKENKDSTAIAHLKTSARISTTDTKQKAKSFLKLADLYFDDKKYPPAQQYYDSTRALLAETHKRYEEVNTRADVLGELVEQLNIIAFEDSVQAFAKLPKDEQERLIKQRIKDRQREEDEKEADEAAAREVQATNPEKPKPQTGGGDASAWYFYNPTQIARGMAEFKKKWGNRPNEDNWRRKDKAGSAIVQEPEESDSDSTDTAKGDKEGEPAWKDPESYMKDVPTDTAALEASNAKICSALYIAGTIYKEKLKDVDNAIESFEVLNGRFEECRYTPESYYQLYRIYLAKEKSGSFFSLDDKGSAFYANVITERWPDSEFARLVRDPNQLMADEERSKKEESDYVEVYRQYREGSYLPVIATCNFVITETPKNHLLPKYHLLKALAIGGTHEVQAFRNALSEVQSKFPGSDEAKAAADILANLDKSSSATPTGTAPPEVVAAPQYVAADGAHFVALVFPNADGAIEPQKTRVSDFNQQNFSSQPMQVQASVLDDNFQIIKVGPFENKAKAMEYYNLFMATPTLSGLNDAGYATFAISSANFAVFYKDKDIDAYASFFSQNYLQGQ
jgi:tetratricopeptide (TPR) repeat protein